MTSSTPLPQKGTNKPGNRLTEKVDSLIEVFDFGKNWDLLVRPHLHHPEVEAALARGMNAYRKMRASLNGNSGWEWDKPWDPELGPLHNDSSDHWFCRCEELLDEAIERGEIEFKWPEDEEDHEAMGHAMDKHGELASRYYPKPDSLEWYVLHNAGHYLAPWQRALGRRIFPELEWKLMTGGFHSIAYGADKLGNIKVIFDLLSWSCDSWTPERAISAASLTLGRPPKTWVEHLTARPDVSLFEDVRPEQTSSQNPSGNSQRALSNGPENPALN